MMSGMVSVGNQSLVIVITQAIGKGIFLMVNVICNIVIAITVTKENVKMARNMAKVCGQIMRAIGTKEAGRMTKNMDLVNLLVPQA